MKGKETWKKIGRHFIPNAGTIALVLVLLWAQQAGALGFLSPESSSTTTISYQGRLADAGGTPIDDIIGMTFRIYNVSTGGSPLWTETYPGVQVSDGLFHILLGSITPIPNSLFNNNDTLYLGFTVGADDEMAPREQLASAPWAMSVPDGSIESRDLNLDYGKICLSDNVSLSMPGGAGWVAVPGLNLSFDLDVPSEVLVWMDWPGSINRVTDWSLLDC